MKKFLEKQSVFNVSLSFLAFFSKRKAFNPFTQWATSQFARLNLFLNKPSASQEVAELGEIWKELMPKDGQENFKIIETTEDTVYTHIKIHCPLRGTGNVDACYKLMNYDRQLMEHVGGQLIVLESQSNSGDDFCRLAIRKKGADVSDLIPAHLKDKKKT